MAVILVNIFELLCFCIEITWQFLSTDNVDNLRNWQKLCNIPDTCAYVWDGFGRWVGDKWKPFNDEGNFMHFSASFGGHGIAV